jgi:hypothetical protein
VIVKPEDELSAFPWVCEDLKIVAKGMTLRDYFAAKAMQVFLTEKKSDGELLWGMNDAAEVAYEMADNMMKAREP